MTTSSIVTGKTYGKLTAVKEASVVNGARQWVFRCACGNEKLIASRSVSSGNTRSCGCLIAEYRKSLKGKLQTKVKPGKRYGRLKAIRYTKTIGKAAYFLFQCRCGNQKEIRVRAVTSGHTTSCGCLRKHTGYLLGKKYGPVVPRMTKRLKPGEVACRKLWRGYRGDAKRRGLDFSLSWEQFKSLTSSVCAYGGHAPSHTVTHKHDAYVYNGIDRIDNTKGYTPENCVSCCRTCNTAKGTKTVNEFILWAKEVVSFHQSSSVMRP